MPFCHEPLAREIWQPYVTSHNLTSPHLTTSPYPNLPYLTARHTVTNLTKLKGFSTLGSDVTDNFVVKCDPKLQRFNYLQQLLRQTLLATFWDISEIGLKYDQAIFP